MTLQSIEDKKKVAKAWRLRNPNYSRDYYNTRIAHDPNYNKKVYTRHDKQKQKDWRQKNIAYVCVASAKHRCLKKGWEFNLDREWAEERYTGHCELTGIEFNFDTNKGPYSPSLDRINNSKGYLKGNCRFILNSINMLKGSGTEEDMYKIAFALCQSKNKI